MKKLCDDKRPIQSIRKGKAVVAVGSRGITKIVAYSDVGPTGYAAPWLAVYEGDHLRLRFEAAGWVISYADPVPAQPPPNSPVGVPVISALRHASRPELFTLFIPMGERVVYLYVRRTQGWHVIPLLEWADNSTVSWRKTEKPAWASRPNLACLLEDD